MRVPSVFQTAAVKSCHAHETGHAGIHFCHSFQFFPRQISSYQRISCLTILAVTKRKDIKSVCHRHRSLQKAPPDHAQRHDGHLHAALIGSHFSRNNAARFIAFNRAFFCLHDGVFIRVGQQVSQRLLSLGQPQLRAVREGDLILHDLIRHTVSVLAEILFIHQVPILAELCLHRRIVFNRFVQWNQIIILDFIAISVYFQHHMSHIGIVAAAGNQISISHPHWFIQRGMAVSADDQVDVRHIFCQLVILRFFQFIRFIFDGPAVRNADDEIHVFLILDLVYNVFRRLLCILEDQSAFRRILHRGLAQKPEDGHLDPIVI